MFGLSNCQYKKALYNYHHNDVFDHVLLDDREPSGRIVTVLEYDEETIMIQTVDPYSGFDYVKYSKEVFLDGSR